MPELASALIADPAERRSTDRRAIGLDTTLRGADAAPLHARVRDLSSDGFSLECAVALSPGDLVTIGLPGVGRRTAHVVRDEPGGYGCRFDAPIGANAALAAFTGETVVSGRFETGPSAAAAMPEPVVERWHPAVRLALLAGSSAALWSAILHFA